MAPLAAIFISIFWCVVAVLIINSRGYSPAGIAICLAGILGGGFLAFFSGRYALGGWGVIAIPGGGPEAQISTIACAAILVGSLCGLYAAERLRDSRFPSISQISNAALGFIFGGLAGYVIIAMTYHTWAYPLATFCLFPATVGTATLAGSAMMHRLPDLK